MNRDQAQELHSVLSRRYPGGEAEVTAQPDGVRIVIEIHGERSAFDVGDWPSAVLSQLLTGYAD